MSAGIANSDLIDLTRTTLEDLPDLNFEYALEYQQWHVINQWFKSDKVKISSGYQIHRNIALDTTGNARHVRLYQKTAINVADTQKTITVPWVQYQTHWSIERREMLRNRKPAKFVDLLQSRRLDSTVDAAELLERKAWATPQNSSDDLSPRGLPYWLSKLAPAARSGYSASIDVDQDFGGRYIAWGDGTFTGTDKAGIDPSTSAHAKWRNYVSTYTAINGDFVKRMRRAFHQCEFQSPITARDMIDGAASKFRIYMPVDELVEYEDLATKQNDNNGGDLDKFHGVTTFRRVPILYAPVLNSDADNPIYAVNHAHFYPVVQEGDWMRESEPMFDVEQHNVMTTFVDGSYNFLCDNVRLGGFVMHVALAA